MKIFNEYGRYYDLLYRDKNYQGEALYVSELIRGHNPKARTVLDLGCGSGRHDRELTMLGFKVTGIDLSQEMLSAARREATGNMSLEYRLGDIRNVVLGRTFDAVICLFHVLSYLTDDNDLAASLETARRHMAPGAIFIFDFWYGPAVLSCKPEVRVKELDDEKTSLTRIARPFMRPDENAVDVNYKVFVRDKLSGDVREIQELHRMRYYFLPEIRQSLERAGLSLLHAHESFRPTTAASLESWSVTVAAELK